MRMYFFVGAFVLGCLAPSLARAGERDVHVSGKMGFSLGGDVNLDPPDRNFDVGSGFMFEGDVDAMVSRQVSVGGRMKLGWPEYGDDRVTLFGIGPDVKLHFHPSPKLRLSPGLAVLYQRVSSFGGRGSIHGLGLEPFIEAGTPIDRKLELVGEFGFNAQPAGGYGDVDATWAPIFHLLIGLRY